MARSLKDIKWDDFLKEDTLEGPTSDELKQPALRETNQKVHYMDQVDLSANPKISFEPRPVVIPFPKTLYGKELIQFSKEELGTNQKVEAHSGPFDATFDFKSLKKKALVYGIPVALVCFFLGIKMGIVCMNSTHGSSLEILLEALKF